MPTEAEWEKAARGGVEGKRFPWGTDTISHAEANYRGDGASYGNQSTGGYHPSYATGFQPYTSPVGSFGKNGYGLYDMTGNVWEWCWDWYGATYYTTSNGMQDPRGPASGTNRVNRGGAWNDVQFYARCGNHGQFRPPDGSDFSGGLRPARTHLIDEMSLIPGGNFTMGRTSGDTDADAPPTSVTLSPFYIQKTETTKAQWDDVRAWAVNNGYTDLAAGVGKASNHPVHTVTWWDVVKWCNARSEKEGLMPVYTLSGAVMRTGTTEPTANWSANGYRLPTEAEWEKAARGGVEGKRFPWGTDTIRNGPAGGGGQANYYGATASYAYDQGPNFYNSAFNDGVFSYTSPVRSFGANGYGLYDMSGNLWERCWDWYGSSYYTTSSGISDPRGPASGTSRVFRGGSWINDALSARCADRSSNTPGSANINYGFRPARSSVFQATTGSDVAVDTRDAPTVTTPTATSITAPGATLGGNVTSDGGAVITERGVVYSATSVNSNPLIGDSDVVKVTATGTTGVFAVSVTGLTQGTVYSYKAYALNSQGATYTSVGTFTTLSTNANLSNLTLSSGTLSPTFSSAATIYTASVTNPISSITVTPTRAQANATIAVRVNDGSYASVTSGSPGGSLALNIGSNTVDVLVTAQDGLTQNAYTVTVLRMAAPTVTTPTATSITATGATLGGNVTSDGGAVITERGVVYSVTATNNDPLIGGTGVTKVATTGTTGVFNTQVAGLTQGTGYSYNAYAINSQGTSYTSFGTFTTLSTNADLSNLTLSSGPLSPIFASGTTSYTASISNPMSSITVTSTRAQANATIAVRVNGGSYASVTSGSPSGSLALNVGSNTVDVQVTAQDGLTQKTYTVTVLRMAAPTVTSPTATSITALGATLGGNVTSDGGATITERGVVYAVTASNTDPLIGGTSVVKVTTMGTTGVFTVPVTGLTQGTSYSYKAYAINSQGTSYTSVGTFTTLSTNANLSSLTLSSGSLSPTFSSAATIYTASVTNPISSITVTPTRAQNNATIAARVNGGSYTSVTSGSPSGSLALNVGSNTVDVQVTAQDGLTQKTYTVTVTRAKAPQTITFASIPDKLTTDVLNLTASGGGSGNPVTFTLTAGPASLIDNVLTFTTSGSVTITASQVGNANYLDAPNVVRTFTVSKATAPIAFSQTVQLANDTPRPVTVSTTPLGLSAVLSYAGAPSAPVLPGAYNVIATIQDLIYQGTASTSLTVLGLTAPDFGRVTLGQVGIQTFTLSNPGLTALTLTGNPLVKILGEHASDFEVSMPPATEIPAGGSVNFEIRFAPTQPGERQAMVQMAFAAPGNSPINFPIQGFGALSSLMAQTISFSAPASVYLSQGPLALTGIASSGLPVSYTLISGPATLQGNLLTVNGPGTIKVEASQPGRGNYASARPVQRTIIVKANPTALTLANLSQVYDGTPRPITVMGVEDATVSYSYPDGLNRSQPPTAAGSYPVSAFAAGILRKDTLVITRAPLIVQPNDQSKHLGQANPELEVTFSGLVTGETPASVLFRPITVTTTAKDSSPPGVYPITSGGGSAANYTLIHRPGKLVVAGYVGSFEALLRDPNTTLPAGLVKVTVPAASRSASAKLMLGIESAPLSLAGPLALDAETRVASGQFSRVVRSTDTYTLNLTVNVFGELNAEVRRNGELIATATDGIRLRDKIQGETVPQAGAYTGEMELGQSAGPNDPSAPGWTTARVDAGGTMAMTGRLGDGTAFTASLPADLRGGYRFFGQPYRPARAGAHVGGLWALAPHPITSGRWKLDGAELTWVKAACDLDPSYRAGFGPLTLAFSMSPWQPSSKTVALTQLLGVDQWTVSHSPTGSASESSLPNLVALNSNNTLQVLAPVTSPANIRRWTSRVNPSTGAFTGSFELLDVTQKRTVNFSGVLRQGNDVQVSQQGRGHYLLPPLKGAANQQSRTGYIWFWRMTE